MFRFRPTVEALGDRALPSAVLAGHDDFTPPTVQTAQLAGASENTTDQDDSIAKKAGKPGGKTGTTQQDYLRVTLSDVLISSYS